MKRFNLSKRKQRPVYLVRATVAIVAAALLVSPAWAYANGGQQYIIQKDQALYGNLDQDDIPNGGQFMCGPTAAVNSFKYLENAYPAIYGNSLVPVGASGGQDLNNDGIFGDSYDDMIAVAMTVGDQPPPIAPAMPQYMNTKLVLGGPGGSGTWDDMFIHGKKKYIEAMLPNKTLYEAQLKTTWAWVGVPARPADEVPPLPKPAWVQQNTQPDGIFLYNELNDCEDVEILIVDAAWGHYLTVTGLNWVDANGDGLIQGGENAQVFYIDPCTGQPGVSAIGGQNVPGDPVRVNYGLFANAELVMTVSESIPEPATMALLAMGGLAALIRRRRKA